PALDNLPVERPVLLQHAHDCLLVRRIEGGQLRDGFGAEVKLREGLAELATHIDLTGVTNNGGKAEVERPRARCHVSAQAPRLEDNALRIDDVDLEDGIDERPYDLFPIVAKGNSFVDQEPALPRSIRHQHVIASLEGGRADTEVVVRDG